MEYARFAGGGLRKTEDFETQDTRGEGETSNTFLRSNSNSVGRVSGTDDCIQARQADGQVGIPYTFVRSG
jgi:hypothetical protein